LPIAIRYDGSAPNEGHGFQLHVGPVNSDVRGEINIKSKNPEEYPSLKFNYLSTEQDRKEWCEAIRCARKIIETDAMSDLMGKEIAPGINVQSDEEILDFIAKEGESAYHLSGTCKMGTDNMSVVNTELKVNDIENLRIVDASIMPTVTNGNIYSPVLMIGEKAADSILGNTPLEPETIEYYEHK
jgi:choline dehydrogenase